MKYDQFLSFIKDREKEYILIKMTDEPPFFLEKVFVKDGESRVDTGYHTANGMFSNYVNLEFGVSIEVSGPMGFEISGAFECPIYAMNAGKNPMEFKVRTFGLSTWTVEPYDVVGIYPQTLARVCDDIYIELMLQKTHPEKFLTQEQIKALLNNS